MLRSAIPGRISWTMVGLSLLLLPPLSGCSSGENATRTTAEPTRPDSARTIAQVESDLVPQLVEGGMLISSGGVEAGIAVLESILPRTAYPAPIHERIARAWFAIGEVEDAAGHVDSAIALGGPTPERLLLRGRIRNALWDDPGAVEDFDRVITLDSSNLEALYLSAHILGRIDPDRSIERYRRILELRPDDLTALEELYDLLFGSRRHPEAAAVAERIFSLAPGHAGISMELPLLRLEMGEVDRAIDWFHRITIALPPDSYGMRPVDLLLARLMVLNHDEGDSTIERFSRAVVSYIEESAGARTFPLQLIVNGAGVAYQTGATATGDRLVDRLLERESLAEVVRISVAATALAAGSSRQAIRLLEAGRSGDNDPELTTLLGNAYLGENRLQEAEASFSDALRHDSMKPGPLLGLARLHALRNDPSEAVRMFELAVAVDPEDREIVTHYGWYLAVTGRHLERGYELVRRVVSEHIDDPDLLEAYAMLSWLTGKRQLAESILTAVDIEHPLTPWGLSVWGDIYASLDRIPMALELWRRGLDRLDAPQAGRGPVPEVEFWKETLREELLKKINSYGG